VYDFDYIRAESTDHALGVLAEHEEDAVIYAGGQSLLNILKQGLLAPEHILDIKGLGELDYIRFDPSSGLAIGALTTHRSVERSADVLAHYPMLARAESQIASVQVRNWATLGGNLCIADPASDAAPVLQALGAEVDVRSAKGLRTVALDDFFVDYYETVLEENELLTEIRVPKTGPRTGVGYEKFRNVEGDAPIVVASAWVALEEDGKTCRDLRLAFGGVASIPLRSPKAEDLLRGGPLGPDEVAQAAEAVADDISPIPDIVCSAEYKTKIAAVLARRTLTQAALSAAGG